LVKAHAARGWVANLVVVHAEVDRVLRFAADGETAAMASYLAGLIRRLAAAGAEVAVIAAITPHMCVAELETVSPIPLVDIVQEIVRDVHRQGLTRVALFGTRFTIATSLFGRLSNLDVVLLQAEEIEAIHQAYVEVVNTGAGEQQYQRLRALAHTLCEREGVEAIILAGTDLALLFNEANTDFPHIDCTRLHLNAIMDRLLRMPAERHRSLAPTGIE